MATIKYNTDDPQQFALYDAEHEIIGHRHNVHYPNKGDAQRFIDRIIASPEWRALGGPSSVTVNWTRHDSGVASCARSKRQINLPGWAYNQKTILHELAHMVTHDGHGREFAGTALMLYRRFIGWMFADAVEAAYCKHGVDYKRRRFKYASAENIEAAHDKIGA